VNAVNEAGSPNNPPEKQGRSEEKRHVFFCPFAFFARVIPSLESIGENK
jgi:hypothetical protein